MWLGLGENILSYKWNLLKLPVAPNQSVTGLPWRHNECLAIRNAPKHHLWKPVVMVYLSSRRSSDDGSWNILQPEFSCSYCVRGIQYATYVRECDFHTEHIQWSSGYHIVRWTIWCFTFCFSAVMGNEWFNKKEKLRVQRLTALREPAVVPGQT